MASAIFADPKLPEFFKAKKVNRRSTEVTQNFGIGRNLVASNVSVWINCYNVFVLETRRQVKKHRASGAWPHRADNPPIAGEALCF
jgi:hypothetical protein